MRYDKLKYIGFSLFIFQLLVVGLWFYVKQPAMDHATMMLKIIPMLFGINLFIALLLHMLKIKDFAKLLFGNAILCPIIFFAGWILWFTYYAQ